MKKHQSIIGEEHRTIIAMLTIYCKAHHKHSGILCKYCKDLSHYSFTRLQKCPFKDNKPTCGNCTVHCYKNHMRIEIKKVMRYSGPRMLMRHPLIAIKHLILSRRKGPTSHNKSIPPQKETT